jgi:hypothetical protein
MANKFWFVLIFIFTLAIQGSGKVYAQLQQTNDALVADFSYPIDFFLPNLFDRLSEAGIEDLNNENFNKLAQENDAVAEAMANIMQEARFVFSGILYGFSFVYRPVDTRRAVNQSFTLTPIASIAVGDPNLQIVKSYRRGNNFYVRLRYRPPELVLNHYRKREYSTMLSATAQGGVNITLNSAAIDIKLEAIKESIRLALDASLRSRLKNKPLQVAGELFLHNAPNVVIKSGQFMATSSIVYRLNENRSHSFA